MMFVTLKFQAILLGRQPTRTAGRLCMEAALRLCFTPTLWCHAPQHCAPTLVHTALAGPCLQLTKLATFSDDTDAREGMTAVTRVLFTPNDMAARGWVHCCRTYDHRIP
eukprot:364814-Chlamydomonas_euryale.AAC.7